MFEVHQDLISNPLLLSASTVDRHGPVLGLSALGAGRQFVEVQRKERCAEAGEQCDCVCGGEGHDRPFKQDMNNRNEDAVLCRESIARGVAAPLSLGLQAAWIELPEAWTVSPQLWATGVDMMLMNTAATAPEHSERHERAQCCWGCVDSTSWIRTNDRLPQWPSVSHSDRRLRLHKLPFVYRKCADWCRPLTTVAQSPSKTENRPCPWSARFRILGPWQ